MSRALRAVVTGSVELTLAGSPYPGLAAWFEDCIGASVEQIMIDAGAPVWDAVGFEQLLAALRGDLAVVVAETARTSVAVLAAAHQVRLAIDGLRAPAVQPAARDLTEQLDRLVYPDLVSSVGPAKLPDLVRYLTAMQRRIDTLVERTAPRPRCHGPMPRHRGTFRPAGRSPTPVTRARAGRMDASGTTGLAVRPNRRRRRFGQREAHNGHPRRARTPPLTSASTWSPAAATDHLADRAGEDAGVHGQALVTQE